MVRLTALYWRVETILDPSLAPGDLAAFELSIAPLAAVLRTVELNAEGNCREGDIRRDYTRAKRLWEPKEMSPQEFNDLIEGRLSVEHTDGLDLREIEFEFNPRARLNGQEKA